MTAAFEMTLETLSLNRPYYLNEVGLRGKSSLFNSAWMRAPSQTTSNGQVGYRLQLLSGLLVKKCRSAPETFSRDTAFSGLGDSPLA
jgi:hypothetical protein